ncbi:MAG: hypothetical protein EOO11_03200 [Chitinophagaceae bacterium]|nr:MAG: hypothetical protein EOO11_03200 [Chitinophagaceae bacterium]
MKSKTNVWTIVALAAAATGIAAWLLRTEKGRTLAGSWKRTGARMGAEMQEVIRGARHSASAMSRQDNPKDPATQIERA